MYLINEEVMIHLIQTVIMIVLVLHRMKKV